MPRSVDNAWRSKKVQFNFFDFPQKRRLRHVGFVTAESLSLHVISLNDLKEKFEHVWMI